MPIGGYVPSSAISKPGVIANSAARPASPYDGQVIYQQDTDQAYVWNGSAWVLLSTGTANPPGLELIGSGTFTNAATFDVTGFTTTYQTFHAVLRVSRHSGAGSSDLTGVLRDSGGPFATNYYGATWYVDYVSGSGVVGARNNGANFYLSAVYDAGRFTNIGIRLAGMNQTSDRPNVAWQTYNHASTRMETGGYEHSLNNNADRFRVSCAVNVTGNWRLYGYREP